MGKKVQKQAVQPWIWNEKDFDFNPYRGYYGFVYLITNLIDNRKYIGKKAFFIKKNGVYKESDWKNYFSSSRELKEEVRVYGVENFRREILSLHQNKTDLGYGEIKFQFLFSVIESGEWFNANIAGRYYQKTFRNWSARSIFTDHIKDEYNGYKIIQIVC